MLLNADQLALPVKNIETVKVGKYNAAIFTNLLFHLGLNIFRTIVFFSKIQLFSSIWWALSYFSQKLSQLIILKKDSTV